MKKIIIRCDGDPQLGLGHVYRCIALAGEFRKAHKCEIVFAVIKGKEGIALINKARFFIEKKPFNFKESKWLDYIIKRHCPDAIVFDIRTSLSFKFLEGWRKLGILIVTMDDLSRRRLASDLAFYPPVPQIKKLSWKGFTGELYSGWEWVIIRKEFVKNYHKVSNKIPKLLITMGGSDPQGMTLKVVKALDKLNESFNVVVVLGSAFQYQKELYRVLTTCKHHVDVCKNVQNMAKLMSQSDLAVASFGVTAYELAAMGVPAIYICLTEDHAESASLFKEEGIAISIGEFTKVTDLQIAEKVKQLLRNKAKASEMSVKARNLIGGRGLERIAGTIIDKFKENFTSGK